MIYFSNESFTTKDVDNNLSSRNSALWLKGASWLKLFVVVLTSTAYIMENHAMIRMQMVSLGILSEDICTY